MAGGNAAGRLASASHRALLGEMTASRARLVSIHLQPRGAATSTHGLALVDEPRVRRRRETPIPMSASALSMNVHRI
jgi:hypothetical protein